MIDHPAYNINRNTTYTVTVGNGGSAGTNSNVTGGTGGTLFLMHLLL